MTISKNNQRALALLMALMICFTSFFGSVQKAQAAALPVVGITAGKVVVGLLAICGVAIAYDNITQIEEAGEQLANDFIDYVAQKSEDMYKHANFWINACMSGYLRLTGEFKEVWQIFKQWVMETFYEGSINGDITIDGTNYPTYTGTNVKYYDALLSGDYPYFLTSKNPSYTEQTVISKTVPLVYYDVVSSNIKIILSSTDDINLSAFKYSINKSGTETINEYNDFSGSFTFVNVSTTTNWTLEKVLDNIKSNVPIFESAEAALSWWNQNTHNGILKGSTDVSVEIIPSNTAKKMYDTYGTLDDYTVIGQNSYIDANGSVIAQDVVVPSWDTLTGLGAGTKSWDDVIADTGSITLDTTIDGTLENSKDITTDMTLSDTITNTHKLNPFIPIDLTKLFPFCIPFDLIDCIKLFNAPAEAPRFEWTLDLNPMMDFEYTFVLDLAMFDDVATMFRAFQVVLFIFGLALATRPLIRG